MSKDRFKNSKVCKQKWDQSDDKEEYCKHDWVDNQSKRANDCKSNSNEDEHDVEEDSSHSSLVFHSKL